MKQTLRIILGSALIAGAFIKAVPALAEGIAPAANVTVVHTADLDLSTKAGRRQLDRRLVLAAHEVCGRASDVDLVGKNAVRSCRHDVLAESRAKSDALLATSHGERSIVVASSR